VKVISWKTVIPTIASLIVVYLAFEYVIAAKKNDELSARLVALKNNFRQGWSVQQVEAEISSSGYRYYEAGGFDGFPSAIFVRQTVGQGIFQGDYALVFEFDQRGRLQRTYVDSWGEGP
jgi:hypothetical protein